MEALNLVTATTTPDASREAVNSVENRRRYHDEKNHSSAFCLSHVKTSPTVNLGFVLVYCVASLYRKDHVIVIEVTAASSALGVRDDA